jgi:hypothetical protein
MSINKERTQRIEDIISRTLVSTQSVNWWEKEMDATIAAMDKWESSNHPQAERELNKLRNKLETLIPRAQMEIEVINKLEKELDAIQKEIDEEAKSKNNKKSKRKKGI